MQRPSANCTQAGVIPKNQDKHLEDRHCRRTPGKRRRRKVDVEVDVGGVREHTEYKVEKCDDEKINVKEGKSTPEMKMKQPRACKDRCGCLQDQ